MDWDQKSPTTLETKKCLFYWQKELENMSFTKPIDLLQSNSFILSDASAMAGATFLHSTNLNTAQVERDLGPSDWSRDSRDLFLQTWMESESMQSSTWREVKTIEAGLGAFGDRLQNSSVFWFNDSTPGVVVTKKGSMKVALNPLAERILNKICEDKNIHLQVKWLR